MEDRFTTIETLNKGGIRVEINTLREQVRSFTESYMIVIPPIIPLVVHFVPLRGPRPYNLFLKDDASVPMVRTKRGWESELQDPNMPYN